MTALWLSLANGVMKPYLSSAAGSMDKIFAFQQLLTISRNSVYKGAARSCSRKAEAQAAEVQISDAVVSMRQRSVVPGSRKVMGVGQHY